MRVLAIETATSACSVALFENGLAIAADHRLVGRGHAEQLLPMIAALDEGGHADMILVDCGPGSFTGIRVGVAAARALAFAWGVPAYGFSSLALIAATDRRHNGHADVNVAIEGGHGAFFIARYGGPALTELEAPRSLPADLAIDAIGCERVVGNAAGSVVAARGWGKAIDVAPDARDALLLPEALSRLPVRPFYGREADAKPMA